MAHGSSKWTPEERNVRKYLSAIKEAIDTPAWREFKAYIGWKLRQTARLAAAAKTEFDAVSACAQMRTVMEFATEFEGQEEALEKYLSILDLQNDADALNAFRDQQFKGRPTPYADKEA